MMKKTNSIKMPRWLVVSLLTLSMAGVLGAGAWWWMKWPERVMSEFCQAASQRKCQRELLDPVLIEFFDTLELDRLDWLKPRFERVKSIPRSPTDLLIAHQEFEEGRFRYVVERGCVTDIALTDSKQGISFRTRAS